MGTVCKKCNEPKPDGDRCRACQREYTRKRYKKNPELYKKYNQEWAEKHPDKKRAQQDRWRAKNPENWRQLRQKWSLNWKRTTVRGVLSAAISTKRFGKKEVSVDADYLVDIWEQQEGLCALTSLPMSLEPGSIKRVSIDRIDSSLGYIPGNIQLVRKWVNTAKRDHSNEEFLELLDELRTTRSGGD